jgi:hypothetical protein
MTNLVLGLSLLAGLQFVIYLTLDDFDLILANLHHGEDPSEIKAASSFVLSVTTGGAILWLIPRTRKKARAVLLPGFAGLFCFFVALWNTEMILRWDTMFQHWLVPIMPRAFVAFTTRYMYPMVYLLGAWALGFALALQVVLSFERKRKTKAVGSFEAQGVG